MLSSGSLLRQLSEREAWKSKSNRWASNNKQSCVEGISWNQMDGLNMYGNENNTNNGGVAIRKRVMVVVDESTHSKHAMIWALTHVANKGDLLTLLHIIPNSSSSSSSSSFSAYLANSLGSLCKASKPEVEVEALVIQGPKLGTVVSQVKKLEVSVLVVGQKKPSPRISCFCGTSSTEEFVDKCINKAECLTIGVRKQSKGMGGYLISTKWRKNFWLLA